jgi:hypothetical protein
VRCLFLDTSGALIHCSTRATAVLRGQIQAIPGRIPLENNRENQLCVPPVVIDGESYRMRAHRARAERLAQAITS